MHQHLGGWVLSHPPNSRKDMSVTILSEKDEIKGAMPMSTTEVALNGAQCCFCV